MRLAAPEWLWLLAVLPAVAGLMVFSALRRQRALARFAGGEGYRGRFDGQVSGHRRLAKALLWIAAVMLSIVALARPQWGTRVEEVTRAGIDVILLVDASLSMSAEDLAPSRLDHALHASGNLIDQLEGNRVGLVAFAGRAVRLCPLTLDTGAVKLFLGTVGVESVPAGGTALAEALESGMDAFGDLDQNRGRGRALVIFSDGEDHEGELDEIIGRLSRAGIAVYSVGCGTSRGGPIPLKTRNGVLKGYKKDREDRVVTTRLAEAALERLALDTGGRYFRATPGELEIDEIARELVGLDAQEFGNVMRVRFEDRYQWFLGAALLLLLADSALSDRRRTRAAA